MDLLRSCYKSRMVGWYRDRPELEVEGEWHFCPAGADFLPFATIFTSSVWDEDAELGTTVGEIREGHRYSKGRGNPRLKGKHFCGSPDLWLNGGLYADRGKMPVDADGVPLCCDAGPADQGGADVNGRAVIVHGIFPARGIGGGVGGGVGIAGSGSVGIGGGAGGSAGYALFGSWQPAHGGGAGGGGSLSPSVLLASGGGLGGQTGSDNSTNFQRGVGGGMGGESAYGLAGDFEAAAGGGMGGESATALFGTWQPAKGGGRGAGAGIDLGPLLQAASGGGIGGESGTQTNLTEPASGGGAGGTGPIVPGSIAVSGGGAGGESGT